MHARSLVAVAAFGLAFATLPANAQYYGDNRARDARAAVDAARDELQAVVRAKRAAFEARPEVVEAKQAADAARAAYEPEQERVLAQLLQDNPAYAERVAEVNRIQEALDEQDGRREGEAIGDVQDELAAMAAATSQPTTRAAGAAAAEEAEDAAATQPAGAGDAPPVYVEEPPIGPDGLPPGRAEDPDARLDRFLNDEPFADATPRRLEASARVLELRTALAEFEEAAIKKDADASATKTAWEQAAESYATMKSGLRAEILNDPEYKAALDRLESAEEQLGRYSDNYRRRRP